MCRLRAGLKTVTPSSPGAFPGEWFGKHGKKTVNLPKHFIYTRKDTTHLSFFKLWAEKVIIKCRFLRFWKVKASMCVREYSCVFDACRGCAVPLSFSLAFFWPSSSAPAHYCVALIWRGQDWVQKCIYLPVQIGPLSVWSLLSLLLKDSEQRRASVSVCVHLCARAHVCVFVCTGWGGSDVSQLAHRPAHYHHLTAANADKRGNISSVILIPLNSGAVLP